MAEPEHNWKFAQCFGDKGDSDDITEGIYRIVIIIFFFFFLPLVYTRYNIDQHAVHFTFDLSTTIVSNCHGVVPGCWAPCRSTIDMNWQNRGVYYLHRQNGGGHLVRGMQNDILGTSKPIDQRAFTKDLVTIHATGLISIHVLHTRDRWFGVI
jgi:hypothetical protein